MAARAKGKVSRIGGQRSTTLATRDGTTQDDHLHTSLSLLSMDRVEYKPLTNHPHNILNGLEVMWRQNALCDVILTVESRRFRAHKTVLASCADYFHSVFTNTPDESHECQMNISLDGIRAGTMETLLECMYTGTISINESNVRELLAASASLKFYAIEEACGEFLNDRLSPSNCLRMLNLAFTYHLTDLVANALKMTALNFMEVSDGFDYQQLALEQLLAILKHDGLKATSELDIFRRALTWIEFDRGQRMKHAANILREIRLPLLTPSDIVDHVETVEYIMEIPECQRLVKEALHYHCLPCRQSILQTARTSPRTLAKRTVILATGGAPRLKTDCVSTDVAYYDPTTDAWSVVTQMAEPRHHHAVAELGDFMYVAGGEQTNDQRSPLNTAYRYDPRNDTWIQIASMKHRRESFQLGVLAGMLYAVGGRVDQDVSLSDVERYNPAVDAWEVVAPLSAPRRSVAVAAHNGRLYAMGGSGHKRISSKVERYNPLSNQWESRRPLATPRFFAMLAGVGNNLYLFGGGTLDSTGNIICAKSVECYYPTTDTWSSLSSMADPRVESGFAVLGDRIYVMGGYSWDKNQRLTSVECYETERDKWTKLKNFPHAYTGVAGCAVTIYDNIKKSDQSNKGTTFAGASTQPENREDVAPSDEDEDEVDGGFGAGDRSQYTADSIPHVVQSAL